MAVPPDNVIVASLGWSELVERSWEEFASTGLPNELAELGRNVGDVMGRPVHVYTMPILHAGVSGLAVPFVSDDGVVIDPCLLDRPHQLPSVVAHELAHILYPRWADLPLDEHDEMEAFALTLGPILLERLPRHLDDIQPLIDIALRWCRRAS